LTTGSAIAGVGAIIGPAASLAVVEAVPSIPGWVGSASPLAIVGFIVWWFATSVTGAIKENTAATVGLKEEQAKTRIFLETRLDDISRYIETTKK